MNYLKAKKEKGFTIMETLVAIAILLLSITGPMAFSQNGLRAAFHARDQITAFYLAQDAIEFVKNRRDHNALKGNQWLDGLVNNSGFPCGKYSTRLGCSVDTTTDVIKNKNPNVCLPPQSRGFDCLDLGQPDGSNDTFLKVNADGQFISSDSGVDSKYSRLVVVEETVKDVEARVMVVIRWKSHETIGVREIRVVEYIYNLGDAWGLID